MLKKYTDIYGEFSVLTGYQSSITNPDISVIISVFNGENFIYNCINSIKSQTYSNIEIVIIDDGSSDSSLDMIKESLKDFRYYKIVIQKNIGLTKSLIRGIFLSTGRYIARQDIDDESLPDRLNKSITTLQKYNLDLLFTRALKFNKIVPNILVSSFCNLRTYSFGNIFIHGTLFIKKSVLLVNLYNDNYKYSQDYKLFYELLVKKYRIGVINEPLYKIGNNAESISNRRFEEQNYFKKLVIKEAGLKFSFIRIYSGNLGLLLRVFINIYSRIIKDENSIQYIK